jgi:hypothetical protein
MSVTFKTKDRSSTAEVPEAEIEEIKSSLVGDFILPSDKEAYHKATFIW